MNKTIFQIEGFDVLQGKIKKLPSKVKKREMLKVLRVASKSTIAAARAAAPVGTKEHKRYSAAGAVLATYAPGNLKKSIGNIIGKKGLGKENAVLYVGPRSKKKKYDGYYGAMVEGGTVNTAAQPFMSVAYKQTAGKVTAEAADKAAKLIQKQINKLSSK